MAIVFTNAFANAMVKARYDELPAKPVKRASFRRILMGFAKSDRGPKKGAWRRDRQEEKEGGLQCHILPCSDPQSKQNAPTLIIVIIV